MIKKLKEVEKHAHVIRVIDNIDFLIVVLADNPEDAIDACRNQWPGAKRFVPIEYCNSVFEVTA